MSLRAAQLSVHLGRGAAQAQILRDVDVTLPEGQTVCLIGESGSGKSILLKALLGVLPDLPGVTRGQLWWEEAGHPPRDLLAGLSHAASHARGEWWVDPRWIHHRRRQMATLWGSHIGYMAQHGNLALDPTRPVGVALGHAAARGACGARAAATLQGEILRRLRLDPDVVPGLYPAQLSGGMAQRVVIALALLGGARTLLADEPTTGLDPESQESLLELLLELRRPGGGLRSLLLVTHDFGVARRLADHVLVMEKGRVVESAPARLFFAPGGAQHPVSVRLLGEFDRLEAACPLPPQARTSPILVAAGVSHSYRVRGGLRRGGEHRPVLDGVDLELHPGEIVGLVGPSGGGKTTLANVLARLVRPTGGRIVLDGEDLLALSGRRLRLKRRHFQLLFQQAEAAIHPRMRVEEALMETARHVLSLPPEEAARRVDAALKEVGLDHRRASFPAHLSGGERRRVGLARVLLLGPRLLIADEPTAGVDASLRAGILATLGALARGEGRTAILLISHDRAVIRHLSDRTFSIRDGRLSQAEPTAVGDEGQAPSREES